MKLGPVTNIDKRNKTMSIKFVDNVISADYDVIAIFPIMANLEESGSRIPGAYSVKLTFLLQVTFYLIENRP